MGNILFLKIHVGDTNAHESMLYPASDIDWQFDSYMIVYMLQCHSPKSSHPRPLPQSPKDCSIHLCLFCCLAYRVIVTKGFYVASLLRELTGHIWKINTKVPPVGIGIEV